MTNLSLFDIGSEFKILSELMEEEFDQETGELINKDKEINELYDGIKLSLEEKFNNSQRYLLSLKSENDLLDSEIKRLQAKKKAIQNKSLRVKDLMLSTLQATDLTKLKTSLFNFSIKKSESVEIDTIDNLSRSYLRIKYEADKTEIKKALKDGVELDGVRLVESKSLVAR